MLIYNDIYSALAAMRVTVEIIQGKDCQHVEIVSPLYVTKRRRLSWCYGADYGRAEILKDTALINYLTNRFGLRQVQGWTFIS